MIRITYIEDDLNSINILRFALSKAKNFELQAYTTGKEGLVGILSDRPDIILLDSYLPDLDGEVVFEEIKKSLDVPVVFITAERNEERLERLKKLDVLGLIEKPFNPLVIVQTLTELLTKSREG